MNEAIVGAVALNPLEIIRTKSKQYKVLHKIGQGGFANVYLVQYLGEEFALKIIELWKFMPNERIEYVARFRQEYDLNRQIQDNEQDVKCYIVRSYDYDFYEGNPFIIMDYCSQGTLRSKIGRDWSLEELNTLAINVLKGLRSLHREGIIHRDIKPDNILLDNDNQPRLSDFGISASIKKRKTMANPKGLVKEVFATATYSPPEQLDYKQAGKIMGNTNDIFAFGATMYEVITKGLLPFGSYDDFIDDMKGYEKRKVKEQWNRSALQKSSTGSVWFEIIEKCLKFRPEDRFQNTDEIIKLLGAPISGKGKKDPKSASAINWAIRVMNGDEIGRIYYLNNLAFSQESFVPSTYFYNDYDLAKGLISNKIKTLSLGWFDEKEPFANDIGIVEQYTNYVSRKHATLIWTEKTSRWYIRDGQFSILNPKEGSFPFGWKSSTNGVLLNSKPIGKEFRILEIDDIITLGDTTLKVLDAE
ncbi:hypothetical protein BH23BAC1_BH23BAC1_25430 [soil metagenome]